MTHILLIDGNNIGYASMYVPALSRLVHHGQPTGGIMGLAQSVMRITELYPGAIPVVLWDGHAAWRKALCPEYKDNRKSTPEKIAVADSWRQQQSLASALLLQMGVIQMRAVDAEADDLAGRLCSDPGTMVERGIERITLVSGDTDWWQAISERVDWFTPITDKTMTLDKLRTDEVKDGPFTGPEEYLLAKCIAGDSSDNIPGVPGVGIATAVKLLRLHGGLDGIEQTVSSGHAKDKKSSAIAENRALIERNRKIMDWRLAPAANPWTVGLVREPFDPEVCQRMCEDFGLARLSARLSGDGRWGKVASDQNGVLTAKVMDFCESMADVLPDGAF
ncbi:5'-3' exonuclease family protein [Acidithiobacillus sulfurivorans]|uniref:DNA polymerase I n=1 Tax=Acidithiobacillus sulfurivorans TaxID=1958756 RepID=A0ABS6A093_9PROT|nr:5'-3' exonuclease H3TH domain-containing protein [Acidithiobacillus sulfurivorans]MBU2760308.1 DNA polymerase I [Acidithiobacillus sulfurivorans]